MGKIILISTFMIEIILTIFCITTKSNQKNIRSVLRLSGLLLFVVLSLVSVVNFGFRWIPFAVLISVWALISVVSLIRKNEDFKSFKSLKTIFYSVARLILIFVAALPVLLFPQYTSPEVTGEYGIATSEYTYTDFKRLDAFSNSGGNRFVNVEFWYPQNANGRYPLLVFSHGAYGVKASNTSTFVELASHGYVVCSIDHPGHSFYTKSENGSIVTVSMDYMNEVNRLNMEGNYTNEEAFNIIQKWMDLRTEDMSFVMDTIIGEVTENKPEEVYALIDSKKIGVFGHSMGGAASVWLGGERNDIGAVVNIDGPYFSELIYDKATDTIISNEKKYEVPVLNIYSDQVWPQVNNNDGIGVYASNNLAAEFFTESYNVYIEGSKHLSLTDLALVSPFLADLLNGGKAHIDPLKCIEKENQIILEFFDYKLKNGLKLFI